MVALRALVVSVLLLSMAAGQVGRPQTYPQRVAAGLRATVASPANHPLWLATGLGILVALPLDHQIQELAEKDGLMPESLARIGDGWGGKWAAVTFLPGICLTEFIRGTPREATFQRLDFAFTSLAAVGITTEALKYIVRRQRPNKQASTAFPYGHSFPSGHASFSFGVAEVLRTLYGNRVGAFFYGLALVTGISRMHDNKHYLSDVVAGAGLGIGIVRGFEIAFRTKNLLDIMQVTFTPNRVVIGIRL